MEDSYLILKPINLRKKSRWISHTSFAGSKATSCPYNHPASQMHVNNNTIDNENKQKNFTQVANKLPSLCSPRNICNPKKLNKLVWQYK